MFSILLKYSIGKESIISYSAPSQSNFKSLQDKISLSSNIFCKEVDSTVTAVELFENIECAD